MAIITVLKAIMTVLNMPWGRNLGEQGDDGLGVIRDAVPSGRERERERET